MPIIIVFKSIKGTFPENLKSLAQKIKEENFFY